MSSPASTPKSDMAEAITNVLTGNGKKHYDQLSDTELLDYADVLWDYYGDLRDEWARREMKKASEKR